MDRLARITKIIAELAFPDISSADARRIAAEWATKLDRRFVEPRLPQPTQSAAVAFDLKKTAALLYDRVWSTPTMGTPDDIAFYAATDLEIAMPIMFENLADDDQRLDAVISKLGSTSLSEGVEGGSADHRLASVLRHVGNVRATPMFSTQVARDAEFTLGDVSVIVATIRDVALVDERSLTWEQVAEFRKDKASRASYIRFTHWLDTEMRGNSTQFVLDEIAMRFDAYERALRRHGIATLLGTIESTLDPKFVGSASAFVAAIGFAAGTTAAAATAVGVIGAKAAVAISRAMLDLADAKAGKFGEVAFVHELKQKVKAT